MLLSPAIIVTPDEKIIPRINDTADQRKSVTKINRRCQQHRWNLSAVSIISVNFRKKSKWSQWSTQVPRGHWFIKKLKSKISCQTPFKRCVNGGFSSVLIVYGFEIVRIITYGTTGVLNRTFTNKIASGWRRAGNLQTRIRTNMLPSGSRTRDTGVNKAPDPGSGSAKMNW